MNETRISRLTRHAVSGGTVEVIEEGPRQFVVERFEAGRGTYDRIEGFQTFKAARTEALSYAE
jgi:hypothetical protein